MQEDAKIDASSMLHQAVTKEPETPVQDEPENESAGGFLGSFNQKL